MRKIRSSILPINALCVAVLTLLSGASLVNAQCNEVITGLRQPLGTALTNQGNLVVSESGARILPGTQVIPGRISVVGPDGNLRPLLDGLPSAINDVGDASGPAGILMRGRTLYVAIGVGDVTRGGGGPGLTIENPAGPSSPLFSSVLSIHFSANVENTTEGFTLAFADQQALAAGETLTLSNGDGDSITVRLIANFPNFVALTPPFIAASNPFHLTAIGDHLYVTDGGRNLVWDVDLSTGSFSVLASFPKIANPLTPIGPALIDAVPTGIAVYGGQLLVTFFTGFPFPAGTSSVQQVDPATGTFGAFITARRTAIDVLPISEGDDTDFLVLEHSSVQVPPLPPLPPFLGSGMVLRFEIPTDPPTVVTSCVTRPTSMTLDRKTGILYVSELSGQIVTVGL
jgi:hypothetical protein